MTDPSDLSPAEIRAIRERLGLTQVGAGELIGGGPRAFAKYEAGTVTPSASVITLLLLLNENPQALSARGPRTPLPTAAGRLAPFEVSGEHIAVLTKDELPELLRRLLHVEAREHGIPADGIHVASNVDAPDGGEDGRISWQGDPDRTTFLPSRFSQFQMKAGRVSPAAAGKEILSGSGSVKEMVRSALMAGGHYIMLCGYPYTQKSVSEREDRIRTTLRGAGMTFVDDQVHVWDADQIAAWVNHHPPVAAWVKERTAPGTIGPFHSWTHWAGRPEHDRSPWVEDERRPDLRGRLLQQVATPGGASRVVGLPGVGKSRLALEALGPDIATEERGISDLVLYATLSEAGDETVKEAVQNLADHGQRAIVVVDDCDSETHDILARMASRSGSAVSLITIDSEVPNGTPGADVIQLDEAPDEVVESVISQLLPGVPSEDHRRLAQFSRGFPGIAIRIGHAWDASVPLAHAADDDLVDAFVLGRKPQDREQLLKSARLLATFGMVGVTPPADGHLGEIASLVRDLSEEDFYSACEILADRGVAQWRGRSVVLQSGPIAMRLAERQWRAWQPAKWESILAGDASPRLKVQAARRLALLNTTGIAPKVVEYVCRDGGPFDSRERAERLGHPEVLAVLAEVSPAVVANQIGRILDDASDLQKVEGDLRRHLVWALEKVAFRAETFQEGALLLLRLAVAENETWSNNATGQFQGLFPLILGGTAAIGEARLSVLDQAASLDDPAQRIIVAGALGAGSRTRDFSRTLGPERQGARPVLQSWRPGTNEEAIEYVGGCLARLRPLAQQGDEAGDVARRKLSANLRGLIRTGFIDLVEQVVLEVATAVDYWPEAAAALRDVLAFDAKGMDERVTERVKALVAALEPQSLDARVQSIVTNIGWDFRSGEGIEAQQRRASEAVHELVQELMGQPTLLESYFPRLSRGPHQMARVLGQALAKFAGGSPDWLERLVEAVAGIPVDERSYDLLAGYVGWLAKNRPDDAEAFKRQAARSVDLAPALPQMCSDPGASPSDVELMLDAFESGLLPPFGLAHLGYGGALAGLDASDVSPMFDAMLDHGPQAYAVAVDLMEMYAFGDLEKLDGLRPQVVKLASNASRWAPASATPMQDYHFEQIMSWMLAKGREDKDASSTALALALGFVGADTIELAERGMLLLRTLLSEFPEVVWPLIGQEIVSDRRAAMRAEFVLGSPFSFGERTDPPILRLPEDTLFAWCHAHPDGAPAFAAKIVPVLASGEDDTQEAALHPVVARLLDEFGEREDVRRALEDNIYTFGWTGSESTYYAQYEKPLSELSQHPRPAVAGWATSMRRRLQASLEQARNEDEEKEAWDEI